MLIIYRVSEGKTSRHGSHPAGIDHWLFNQQVILFGQMTVR
jgi:hypothetical protein